MLEVTDDRIIHYGSGFSVYCYFFGNTLSCFLPVVSHVLLFSVAVMYVGGQILYVCVRLMCTIYRSVMLVSCRVVLVFLHL